MNDGDDSAVLVAHDANFAPCFGFVGKLKAGALWLQPTLDVRVMLRVAIEAAGLNTSGSSSHCGAP